MCCGSWRSAPSFRKDSWWPIAAFLPMWLGVALVSELAAQACRDAGEEGLALHVETGAKVILLLLSAPLLRQLAGLVMELTA